LSPKPLISASLAASESDGNERMLATMVAIVVARFM
jgi:hypothetical protein